MPEELPGEIVGAPEVPQPSVDWEKRYTDTHAEYNRLNEQLRRFESDPTAVIEFIQAKHPDLLAAEAEDTPEPEYDEDDDPRFEKLTELEKRQQASDEWIAQQTAAQAQQAFDREVAAEAGDRKLGRQAKEWIFGETLRLGNGPENLAKATKAWLEYEDELRGPQRKPAPTPPQPGKAAEVDRNASKDPAARRAARRAQIAAQLEAGQQ